MSKYFFNPRLAVIVTAVSSVVALTAAPVAHAQVINTAAASVALIVANTSKDHGELSLGKAANGSSLAGMTFEHVDQAGDGNSFAADMHVELSPLAISGTIIPQVGVSHKAGNNQTTVLAGLGNIYHPLNNDTNNYYAPSLKVVSQQNLSNLMQVRLVVEGEPLLAGGIAGHRQMASLGLTKANEQGWFVRGEAIADSRSYDYKDLADQSQSGDASLRMIKVTGGKMLH